MNKVNKDKDSKDSNKQYSKVIKLAKVVVKIIMYGKIDVLN